MFTYTRDATAASPSRSCTRLEIGDIQQILDVLRVYVYVDDHSLRRGQLVVDKNQAEGSKAREIASSTYTNILHLC